MYQQQDIIIYYALQILHFIECLCEDSLFQIFNPEFNFLNQFVSKGENFFIGIVNF